MLKDVIIIFGLSVLVIYLFHKIRVPSIIGFLLTGILAGPHGFGIINATHEVEILAEIGVILLLFTIGIEFSVKKFLEIKRSVLLGGFLQVFLVISITALVSVYFGFSFNKALYTGFLVALSSTAVVLKLIQSKGEIGSFHGETSLAILIFQDIIVVPMMLIIPFLANAGTGTENSLLILLFKSIAVIVFLLLAAKYVVPKILYNIAKTQSRELFILTIIVIGFAVAWLTSSVGLSLALGAFIAGLIISESEYSHQAIGDIIPFRDVFTSFFFVSVGMLVNISFFADHFILIILISVVVLLLKSFVSGLVAFILGFPFRTTVIVGLTLSQIGEFSFILSKIGIKEGLMSDYEYQLFLAVTVLTISVTPLIMSTAPKLADILLKLPLPRKLKCGLRNIPVPDYESMENHLVIVGYGINGRNVARAAKYASIPHVIVEMNPDTVISEQDKGELIYYGDATQPEILHILNTERALILVITIPHLPDAKRIILNARKMNPNIHIIVRTRFINNMKNLYELGADEVIPEEFETSIEIFTRVLAKYLIPHDDIENLVSRVRSDGYKMFRSLSLSDDNYNMLSVAVPNAGIHTVHVCEDSEAAGKTLKETGLSLNDRITLLAISRNGIIINNPGDNFQVRENDILFFLGPDEAISPFYSKFRKKGNS